MWAKSEVAERHTVRSTAIILPAELLRVTVVVQMKLCIPSIPMALMVVNVVLRVMKWIAR
jgi:hypothetical protein